MSYRSLCVHVCTLLFIDISLTCSLKLIVEATAMEDTNSQVSLKNQFY